MGDKPMLAGFPTLGSMPAPRSGMDDVTACSVFATERRNSLRPARCDAGIQKILNAWEEMIGRTASDRKGELREKYYLRVKAWSDLHFLAESGVKGLP